MPVPRAHAPGEASTCEGPGDNHDDRHAEVAIDSEELEVQVEKRETLVLLLFRTQYDDHTCTVTLQ